MNDQSAYNEQNLFQLASEGDERSFGLIYKQYYPQLRPFIRKYADSALEAEEIIQDVFVRVWLNREKLPEIENLHAWIFKIASNEFLSALRKKLHDKEKMGALIRNKRSGGIEASPFDLVHIGEIKRIVKEAVESLPAQRRRIFQLSRDEGLKIAEIAERLSISPRTVKNTLTICLKHIREYLSASGHPFLLIFCLFQEHF
ncbi:MAG TPA: RNA polymerase sigma-70 factor [Flavitalea sp.]|nr:RNA polymerase sigma-70 factor [Flavitalea sp.]